MSASPLKSVDPTTPTPPGQPSAQPEGRADAAKLVGILVLVVMVLLTTLIFGIIIGNAARKRFDRWSRGY